MGQRPPYLSPVGGAEPDFDESKHRSTEEIVEQYLNYFPGQPISEVMRMTPTEIQRLITARVTKQSQQQPRLKFATMEEYQRYKAEQALNDD